MAIFESITSLLQIHESDFQNQLIENKNYINLGGHVFKCIGTVVTSHLAEIAYFLREDQYNFQLLVIFTDDGHCVVDPAEPMYLNRLGERIDISTEKLKSVSANIITDCMNISENFKQNLQFSPKVHKYYRLNAIEFRYGEFENNSLFAKPIENCFQQSKPITMTLQKISRSSDHTIINLTDEFIVTTILPIKGYISFDLILLRDLKVVRVKS